MTRALNRFAAWLFKATGGDDAALGRLAMSVVTPRQTPEGDSRAAANVELHAVANSSEFRKLLEQIQHEQRDYVAQHATPESFVAARGVMAGVMLVRQRVDRAAAEHEEATRTRKAYNKHSPI